jgi:AcrR family transcriptional regulator
MNQPASFGTPSRSNRADHPRESLSRERLLQTALTLADTAGIQALTMRRLGQELGVEAMSLYNHVANKDDILSGIFDLVMQEIPLPDQAAHWKTAIRDSAVAAFRVLLRHRWAASQMMSPSRVSQARLHWMEAVLGCLRRSGFSAELTCHAYHAIDSHITGFALWQQTIPFKKSDLLELGAAFIQHLPADTFPYLIEHVHQHLNDTSHDGMGQFEFGLDLILDSLERLRERA